MKQNLAVLFGGQSSEHEISCLSAQNIIKNVDTERYVLYLIGITEEGHWVKADSIEAIADGTWRDSKISAILSPDATKKCVYFRSEEGTYGVHIDVIFPVLHGLYGEDGTVQGLFELAKIPYVGCGVLASAVGMDKIYTKVIVDNIGIRQAAYVAVHRTELKNMDAVVAKVEAKLPYPVFVKPSCAGSSKGVSKAKDREGLKAALTEAARHDGKILVEETITGREIECAAFGNGEETRVSGVGEVLAASSAAFYDFDAKYNNAESRTDTAPVLPDGAEEEIRNAAKAIFDAIGGFSLSRVDFFFDEKGLVFNEINTLPGFTAISMYPMLWEKQGISKKQLVQDLIDTAFMRREH